MDTADPGPGAITDRTTPSPCPPHTFITTSPRNQARRSEAGYTGHPAQGRVVPPGSQGLDQTPTNLLANAAGLPSPTTGGLELMDTAAEWAARSIDMGADRAAFDITARATETALLTSANPAATAVSVPVLTPSIPWVGAAPRQWHEATHGVEGSGPPTEVLIRLNGLMGEFNAAEQATRHPDDRRTRQATGKRSSTPSRAGLLERDDRADARTCQARTVPWERSTLGEPVASAHLAEAFKIYRAGRATVAHPDLVGRAGNLTPAQADRAGHAERRRTRRRPRDPLDRIAGRSRLPFRDHDAESGRAW
ncbi:hypothetical protein AB0M20_25365 [Actinoplanes sp. NPDC051633]|uniref:hypothetical protein n=1 Tax=Actinoplanes sp. NPDC051633 TaxID=3155670 RepID=UPI00341B956B